MGDTDIFYVIYEQRFTKEGNIHYQEPIPLRTSKAAKKIVKLLKRNGVKNCFYKIKKEHSSKWRGL